MKTEIIYDENLAIKFNRCMFPDEYIYNQFLMLFKNVNKRVVKAFIYWAIIAFLGSVLSFIFDENAQYIFVNIFMFVVVIGIIISFYMIFRNLTKVYKNQYLKLLENQGLYKHEIILHRAYNKMKSNWNIIYFIIMFIATSLSVSNFITDLVTTNQTSFGPIVLFLIVSIIFVIPAIILNVKASKAFYKKHEEIINIINEKYTQ